MKLVRLDPDKECKLWEFVERNLPPTLRAQRLDVGYGYIRNIEVKERTLRSHLPFRPGIATVEDDAIELRHPQYFSDFSDIIRKYESATGKEVTLRYWQAS